MKSKLQIIFEKELNVTADEWSALINYGYADQYYGCDDILQWQRKMREAMMEDEGLEMELGEYIFLGNDKNLIINVLNR